MATFMAFFVNTAGKPVEETFSGIREIIGKSEKDKEIEGFVTANYRDPHPWGIHHFQYLKPNGDPRSETPLK